MLSGCLILCIPPGSNARSLRSLALTLPLDPLPESPHLKCKNLIGRDSGFGRTAIFTDRKDWDDECIARTYFARSAMEEDYHVLKDTLLFPVMPIYHRFDKRIRAHVFMCVMGLLFYRYIQWKVEKATGERVPIGRLAAQLSRIRLGGLITNDGKGRKILFKLEQMEKEERALVKALDLERFILNKA